MALSAVYCVGYNALQYILLRYSNTYVTYVALVIIGVFCQLRGYTMVHNEFSLLGIDAATPRGYVLQYLAENQLHNTGLYKLISKTDQFNKYMKYGLVGPTDSVQMKKVVIDSCGTIVLLSIMYLCNELRGTPRNQYLLSILMLVSFSFAILETLNISSAHYGWISTVFRDVHLVPHEYKDAWDRIGLVIGGLMSTYEFGDGKSLTESEKLTRLMSLQLRSSNSLNKQLTDMFVELKLADQLAGDMPQIQAKVKELRSKYGKIYKEDVETKVESNDTTSYFSWRNILFGVSGLIFLITHCDLSVIEDFVGAKDFLVL